MLAKVASKNGINLKSLGQGEYVVFTNRAQNSIKMFAGSANLIAYFKLPSGKLDLRTIASIPEYFNGTEIEYQAALKRTIEKDMGVWQ